MNDLPIELDVLAVFSHPDDAELSVAGTLLRLKSMGYRTGVCDMTRGEMGTRGTPEIRAQEAMEGARIMKLDLRTNLEQPDGHVWPTTHWDDPHPDHANTCQIVRQAARLATMGRYDEGAGQKPAAMPAIMHS